MTSSCGTLTLLMSGLTMMATTHLPHPPSTEAILMGGSPTSMMACGAHAGVSDNGGERAATPAVAAVAGRGGTEAPAGENHV
jgi:hypothetical protein